MWYPMLNIVALKKVDRNVLEWAYESSSSGASQPKCWAYIPGPMTYALATRWGRTQSQSAITGSMKNGIDQKAANQASSTAALRPTPGPPRPDLKSRQK